MCIRDRYRTSDFLEDCVKSILLQDCGDFEIIFVDDASTDGSLDLLNSLQVPHSRILLNSANRGPGPSRNLGLATATGTFIRFVDADDILPEGSTSALLDTCSRFSRPAARGNIAMFHTSHPELRAVDYPVCAARETPFWALKGMALPWFFTNYAFRRDYLENSRAQFSRSPLWRRPCFPRALSVRGAAHTRYRYAHLPCSKPAGARTDVFSNSYCRLSDTP
ncbi:glycosyltransferase family 2 protein [Pantanalinema rosaneae CENA516]|uniref:glycosyltransferase family 2 protein n=1 Tax=Pantanalinema rosaneae TaxID=1620701 RepID=UPI003D6DD1AF